MTEEQPGHANGGASQEVIEPPAEAPHLPAVTTHPTTPVVELTLAKHPAEGQTMLRIENLPREAGWVLVTAGVVGLIVPGIPGAPFLVAGAFVLTPGGTRRLSRWAGRNPPKFVNSALRQIGRLLDNLERRYPHRRHADIQ